MLRAAKAVRRAVGRFRRDESGHSAVEFALVALPFFMLMVGLAEVTLIGFAQTTLDHAVTETARGIRTGEMQEVGATQGEVEGSLCDEMNDLLPVECAGNLYLDVDSFPSFNDLENESPISGGMLQTGDFGYDPGGSSSIVVVRAYYRWHIITPLFDGVFANAADGERILVSTMMFRNEPF